MRNEDDDIEYFAAQVVGGLAVIGAVAILLFIASAIFCWLGI